MAELESNRSRRWLWAAIALFGLIVLFFIVRSFSGSPVTVTTATVGYQDSLSSTVSTNGKVEPFEDFQAHAPTPGIVKKLMVSVGEKVAKGQDLLSMDTSDAQNRIATAKASLESAESNLHNLQQGGTQDELLAEKADMTAAETQQREAASSLATLQQLQAKGAASANEVAVAQQHLKDAQAKISQLRARRTGRFGSAEISAQRAQVDQAKAGLAAAQNDLANVDIRAPFAGTVYSIPVSQYDYIGGGEALLNMADLNRIQVRAYFDEPDIGHLAVGQPVTIIWDAKPGQTWHGHVTMPPTTIINYNTRNVGECLIAVDDARGDLPPNTNVTVKVTTQQKNHVLSIPREALHTEGTKNYVFKIVDGHLQRTPVQTGSIVKMTRAEIVSGISEGDTVVRGATSEAELQDGMPVKVQQ